MKNISNHNYKKTPPPTRPWVLTPEREPKQTKLISGTASEVVRPRLFWRWQSARSLQMTAREGMKEREGDKKKRGREEAGGKQGTAKSRIKRATPLLAPVALAMVVEALLNFQFRSEARAQWSMYGINSVKIFGGCFQSKKVKDSTN